MFKFNFQISEENGDEEISKTQINTTKADSNNDGDKSIPIEWRGSEEILPNKDADKFLTYYKLISKTMKIGDKSLHYAVSTYIPPSDDIERESENKIVQDLKTAEVNKSDLISGIYEGGAKIWECTEDLLSFLAQNYRENLWENKRVLDLGCGAGLLGIYALKCGATVQFQDYNESVLRTSTIPNVFLNTRKITLLDDEVIEDNGEIEKEFDEEEEDDNDDDNDDIENPDRVEEEINADRYKFYSGDWAKYAALTKNDEKFDFILTAETIYNPVNQKKLLDTFDAKLKSTGIVLVAAKTYYFGVGGGTRQFEDLIKEDKRFQTKVIWTTSPEENGLMREILELKRKV